MYIFVITLEDKRVHVTASSRGFYVNQTNEEIFNPLSSPCISANRNKLPKRTRNPYRRPPRLDLLPQDGQSGISRPWSCPV